MKIVITPEKALEFSQRGKPAILTISEKSITFNTPAAKLLGLSEEYSFSLEFEDGILYYCDKPIVTNESKFKIVATGKHLIFTAYAIGISGYLDTFLKRGLKTFRFHIGEFKEGRRRLELIEKSIIHKTL